MKLNSSKVFFLTFMMIGVMMCLSSNNWIMIWCGLEISLITFLPLMSSSMILTSEASIKYFLIQSISSSILMLGIILMLNNSNSSEILMMLSLMIKMGVAPFHNWVLSIIEGLSFNSMSMMLTILKLAPLMFASYLKVSLMLIISLTLITGSIMGLNQSSTRKLIAYSSIFNMGLILSTLSLNSNWLFYFLVYSFIVCTLLFVFYKTNLNYVNQLSLNDNSSMMNISLWFILLSLGGMPPFLGFSAKLVVIEFLINEMMMINLILIIFCSLLVMFFYIRMTYLSIMFFSLKSKMSISQNDNMSFAITIINFLSLPMILTYKMFC